jgi:hypothetical protein
MDWDDHPLHSPVHHINLETGMERDEDGVVLGSTRLSGSQRLHRKGDATREAGSLVGPMTAADSPSAISVSRINVMASVDSSQTPALLFCKLGEMLARSSLHTAASKILPLAISSTGSAAKSQPSMAS